MKISLLKLTSFLLLSVFVFGCNTSEKCNNGILNSAEDEIDCGGDCDPCPPEGTLSMFIFSNTFYATSVSGSDNGNGIDIFSSGTGGVTHNVRFSGVSVDQFSPITGADFYSSISGSQVQFQFGDTGSVYITAHDELRKIVSGRYWCSMTDGGTATITDGIFENVRYN